jgi:hypothetical protein
MRHMNGTLGASQPHDKTVIIRVGTFNVGVTQEMLMGKCCEKWLSKLEHVVQTLVSEGQLDLLSLCEVGGHKEGFSTAHIHVHDLGVFKHHKKVRVDENYLSTWGHREDASQLLDLLESQVLPLHASAICEAQLVIQFYTKPVLILGNLHIKTWHGRQTIITETRKSLVHQALQKLDAARDSVGTSIPAILLGDCNLNHQEGLEAVQTIQTDTLELTLGLDADWEHLWHVHGASGGRRGDIAFVKGANAQTFDLPVGMSFADKGVRYNCHDAFGLELGVRVDCHDALGLETSPLSKKQRISEAEPAQLTPMKGIPKWGGIAHVPQPVQPTPIWMKWGRIDHVPQLGATSSSDEEWRPSTPRSRKDDTPRNALMHIAGGDADVPQLGVAPSTSHQQSAPSSEPLTYARSSVAIIADLQHWWVIQEHRQDLVKEKHIIQSLLFAKVKHPVPEDLWIAGQAREVTAVASMNYGLHKISALLQQRQEWLQREKLPLHFQMRDGISRNRFVTYCKDIPCSYVLALGGVLLCPTANFVVSSVGATGPELLRSQN